MGGRIPQAAVGISIAVLIYSFICLTCSSLVVGLLLTYGENWTYVTLLCSFTALSTAASIIQQFHYAFAWEAIKQAQFEKAVEGLTNPVLALGGAAQIVDVVLFDIQFYCYNAMSLNVLFWSITLFTGSWGIRSNWMGAWHERVAPMSKAFAILFPAIIVGLSHAPASFISVGAFFAVTNFTMLGSLAIGSVLLVLILYKYMKTRRLLAGVGRRGGWWASGGSKDRTRNRDIGAGGTTESVMTSSTQRSIYDRALIIRFTIGFVILAIFEAAIIGFSLFQQPNNNAIAKSGAPNHTVGNTISDILLFIPGVTASLVVFLVFGTTKSWRQYRDLLVGGCGLRRIFYERRTRGASIQDESDNSRGLEFERLPSLPNRGFDNNVAKAERRVRMFVTSMQGDPETQYPDSPNEVEAPARARAPSAASGTRNFDFHKPRHVDMAQIALRSPTRESTGTTTSGVSSITLTPRQHEKDPVFTNSEFGGLQYLGTRSPAEFHPMRTRSMISGESEDGLEAPSRVEPDYVGYNSIPAKWKTSWPAVRDSETRNQGSG